MAVNEILRELSGYLIVASLFLGVMRFMIGPRLPDRVMSLDFMGTQSIGLMAWLAVSGNTALYVDIGMVIALVGFLSMLGFSRYIHDRGGNV